MYNVFLLAFIRYAHIKACLHRSLWMTPSAADIAPRSSKAVDFVIFNNGSNEIVLVRVEILSECKNVIKENEKGEKVRSIIYIIDDEQKMGHDHFVYSSS